MLKNIHIFDPSNKIKGGSINLFEFYLNIELNIEGVIKYLVNYIKTQD